MPELITNFQIVLTSRVAVHSLLFYSDSTSAGNVSHHVHSLSAAHTDPETAQTVRSPGKVCLNRKFKGRQ